MSKHRLTRTIAAGAVGFAGLGAAIAMPVATAGAATPPVNITAKCSGSSTVNLQLQREGTGKLGVDFGVDMARHKAGVQWKVTESDNGTTFVNKTAKTIRDGSFSITTLLAPVAGLNTVTGTASNATTGETCTLTASI